MQRQETPAVDVQLQHDPCLSARILGQLASSAMTATVTPSIPRFEGRDCHLMWPQLQQEVVIPCDWQQAVIHGMTQEAAVLHHTLVPDELVAVGVFAPLL